MKKRKKTKSEKKLIKKRKKRRFLTLLIFLIIVAIAYSGLKIKENIHFKKEEPLLQVGIDKNTVIDENVVNKYEYIKNNINETFYEDEVVLSDINKFISKIENKIGELKDEVLIEELNDIYNEFKDIKEYDNNTLTKEYNNILELYIKYYSEEEKITFQNLKDTYLAEFKEEKYKSAKYSLDEIKSFSEETNKLANKRRLDEIYDKNYNESSYLREPKIIDGILLVNKEFGLSESYAPGEDYQTRQAFENMKNDALNEGIYLEAFSTYRSYYTQYDLYTNYVYNYGKEKADTFSARAGFSEHQTGLAFDIGGVDRSLWAKDDFKYTVEAIWLKENAYKYGFILRYPEGKEWITGYMYESWHFRYVGIKHSVNFKNNNLTLEEYLNY